MRLTLRTLLAYMDGMLDPEDEKVLDAKIKESEFASDLVERIRNAMRQLRLGAPQPDAKGGNDANLVADYLDGVLPEEKVQGFERMCLDSDLNLSEVAACHQILMRVLGEPAEVRPELRTRIYHVPEVAAAAVEAPPVQPGRPEEPKLSKEDVEELVAPANSRSLAPAIGVLVAAIVVLALLIWWPFGGPSPLASLIGGNEPAPANGEPDLGQTGAGEDAGPGEAGAGEAPTAADNGQPGENASGVSNGDGGPGGNETPPTDADSGAATSTDENPTGDTPAPDTTPNTTPDAPPETPADAPPTPADGAAGEATTPPGEAPAGATDGASDTVVPPAATAEMGRYTNTQQVLLREEGGVWMRVTRVNLLRERDTLACPPYYRPSISLVNGVQLIFAGPSNATLVRRDENDTPTIGLQRGRVVLVTSGKAGAAAVVAVGGREARVTFGDAESTVAIEVRDFLHPGSSADDLQRNKVVEVYPLGGSITWTEPDTELVIRPGQMLAMTDEQPVRAYAAETTPQWADLRISSSVAERAAETLEPAILDGRPASLSLQEKVSFRQQETAALAIDTLCQIGEVEHAIRAFTNDKQHAYWPQHVAALRNEIARSNESAQEVRDALAALHPENAELMFELIVGYSNAQLADGKAAALVALLESDKMPLRVLAYENLRAVTGRSNFYQAQKVADRQKDKVRFWKGLNENGQVSYPVPPAPLPTREPLTE